MTGPEVTITIPEPHAAYLELLRGGDIAYQGCDGCGAAVFYPRVTCPGCGSGALRWLASAGLGTVYSTTAVMERDGSAYAVCLVDLDEGFRMMSTVVDAAAQDVTIGARVAGRVERTPREGAGADEDVRVVFELEAAS